MIKRAKILDKLRSALKEYKANYTGSRIDGSVREWRRLNNKVDSSKYQLEHDSKRLKEALDPSYNYSDKKIRDLRNKVSKSTKGRDKANNELKAAHGRVRELASARDKTRRRTHAAAATAAVAGGLTLRALLKGSKASKSNRLIEKLKRNKGEAALGGFGTVAIADLALENRRKRKKLEASKLRTKKK